MDIEEIEQIEEKAVLNFIGWIRAQMCNNEDYIYRNRMELLEEWKEWRTQYNLFKSEILNNNDRVRKFFFETDVIQ